MTSEGLRVVAVEIAGRSLRILFLSAELDVYTSALTCDLSGIELGVQV